MVSQFPSSLLSLHLFIQFLFLFFKGFPEISVGKELPCNAGEPCSIPGSGRSPGKRIGHPLLFWPREFQGLCSPWGCKELDMTEHLFLFLIILKLREILQAIHTKFLCIIQTDLPTLTFCNIYQITLSAYGASLVAQWLRIHLSMQETRVPPWSAKIPHVTERLSPCVTTIEPVLQSPGAITTEALRPQSLCSATREATARRNLLTATREKAWEATKTQQS